MVIGKMNSITSSSGGRTIRLVALISSVLLVVLSIIIFAQNGGEARNAVTRKWPKSHTLSEIILNADHVEAIECHPLREATLHGHDELQNEYHSKHTGLATGGSTRFMSSLENLTHVDMNGTLWFETKNHRAVAHFSRKWAKGGQLRVLQGDHVAYLGWFSPIFAHVVMDHLPFIAWLRQQMVLSADSSTKLLLLETNVMRGLLEWIDPQFVKERIVWVKPHVDVLIENGTLTTVVNSADLRHQQYFQALRQWAVETKHVDKIERSSKYIVYISRNAPGAHHGRRVDPTHEADMLTLIEKAMKRHGRKEKLIVFNGMKENNAMVTFDEQFELFQSAHTVIGGHGGAFANIMWMGDLENDICDQSTRPQVLEFLIGPGSNQVQPLRKRPSKQENVSRFRKTYYSLYHTSPWVQYHHVLYARNSTGRVTYVNLTEFEQALDAMWSD